MLKSGIKKGVGPPPYAYLGEMLMFKSIITYTGNFVNSLLKYFLLKLPKRHKKPVEKYLINQNNRTNQEHIICKSLEASC